MISSKQIKYYALVTADRAKEYLSYKYRECIRMKSSYLCLLPFALIFIVFTVIPVFISVFYSFTYYNILQKPQFIGFENYINLFTNDLIFIKTAYNTLLFAVVLGPVALLAALMFAWMLNELPAKTRSFLVLILYAPSISGAAYLVWRIIFSGDALGYLNGFLINFGIINEPVQWLTDEKYMKAVVIITALWMSLGTGFLSMVAGLKTLDRTYYEAGYVDGIRNRWQELWFITLPLLKSQLMFAAVMSITASFAISDPIMNLIGYPNQNDAVTTVVMHMNDYATARFDLGYATAIATLLFIVMVTANKGVQTLLSKLGK